MNAPRHPRRHRLRRAAKWTGAGLCALIFAAWFASGGFRFRIQFRRGSVVRLVEVTGGSAVFAQVELGDGADFPEGWQATVHPLPSQGIGWYWLPYRIRWTANQTRHDDIGVPLYVPFMALALPMIWLFYRDRRIVRWAGAGRCVGCGYDLSGLPPGAACPECGKGASA